ncbi:hypothetical protein OG455_41690 [Kitasatospora sp. NBC_01287]|uniref:hypothetical protein n=1 Tax=Kitasatospora sp. NBC_01287 TaxID=2903573 RepID=UPI0022583E5F|nr:hypothetical protein [Kitasatospora sp. NBC_01287]MCX4751751.1 hypothetical protein [Kitasatospora sp. NBC_01287]MCX4751957.1 hypothetical protein [Kitasatospora sp. NBC_01287]
MTDHYGAQVRRNLHAAEEALTRVLRLAQTLPADVRTQIEAAIDGPAEPEQPDAEPCTGRPGFCRPCRTVHPRPS